jgi:hypothetical protein
MKWVWSVLDNGSLLAAAEANFDTLITTDQSTRHHTKPADRRLAISVLPTTSWRQIRTHQMKIATAIARLRPGDVLELMF